MAVPLGRITGPGPGSLATPGRRPGDRRTDALRLRVDAGGHPPCGAPWTNQDDGPGAALEEKAATAAWKTKPSWDIVTTRDLNIPAAVQRFMAKRAHAHTTEVAASHSVAVSHPHLVADVIEQAAHATVH
ncbi:alpha/beta fold hydrolase [Streptomyces sp. NPDC046900]|uniref:alpha/beta fold hydrolase n=1 Tax=Streptomyces sp. NPDC046900 TaxID=3155473 RepID=UPI0033ED34CD